MTGEPLTRCPRRDEIEAEREAPAMLVQLYRMRGTYHPLWEKGHLLVSGGASEQPARYVETMYALDALAATSRRRYAEIKHPTTTPPTRED